MSHNLVERRSNDAQIGYLMGRMQSMEERMDSHTKAEEKCFDTLNKSISELKACIDKRLGKIENQMSMYRHLIFFTKTLFTILAALLAFKWGAAKIAWANFVHM